MRVLVVTNPSEDYLADQVLYGLRRLLGPACVDWPRKDVMYRSCPVPGGLLYGRGFTIWKLLEEEPAIDRTDPFARLAAGAFDLVVFSSIHRQQVVFDEMVRAGLTGRAPIVFLDGEDEGTAVLQPVLPFGRYYRRESARGVRGILPISFSIPAAKISPPAAGARPRLFATHVQCREAYRHPWIADHCREQYVFSDEAAYYRDLACSAFGVTQRKGGWECMRHYEMAANGAIPCFYQLARKPADSAPHGLEDGVNCLAFEDARDLALKTEAMLMRGIEAVQAALADWILVRTCEATAARILRRD